jgi:hypothetical protein
LPTKPPAPTTKPPTATPTPISVAPTATPQEISYQVFTAGEPVNCWCNPYTGELGAYDGDTEACLDALPSECQP